MNLFLEFDFDENNVFLNRKYFIFQIKRGFIITCLQDIRLCGKNSIKWIFTKPPVNLPSLQWEKSFNSLPVQEKQLLNFMLQNWIPQKYMMKLFTSPILNSLLPVQI
jgi:hypothetical protein